MVKLVNVHHSSDYWRRLFQRPAANHIPSNFDSMPHVAGRIFFSPYKFNRWCDFYAFTIQYCRCDLWPWLWNRMRKAINFDLTFICCAPYNNLFLSFFFADFLFRSIVRSFPSSIHFSFEYVLRYYYRFSCWFWHRFCEQIMWCVCASEHLLFVCFSNHSLNHSNRIRTSALSCLSGLVDGSSPHVEWEEDAIS